MKINEESKAIANALQLHNLKNKTTRLLIITLFGWKGKEGIKFIQKVLNKMNKMNKMNKLNKFNKLVVDGDFGPKTIKAVKSVNNSILQKKLYDELITENNYLDIDNKKITNPKWLNIAIQEIGQKEFHGIENNPRILEYHSVSGGFGTDEVPWCGSFVNWVMYKAGFINRPEFPARAKSWLKFGKSSKPVVGAIAVKSRKGGGHVGFVMGEDKSGEYVYILGGNQSDAVNIKKYRKSAFMDFRVPKNFKGKRKIFNGISEIAGSEA